MPPCRFNVMPAGQYPRISSKMPLISYKTFNVSCQLRLFFDAGQFDASDSAAMPAMKPPAQMLSTALSCRRAEFPYFILRLMRLMCAECVTSNLSRFHGNTPPTADAPIVIVIPSSAMPRRIASARYIILAFIILYASYARVSPTSNFKMR